MKPTELDKYFCDNPINEIVPGLYSIILPPASADILEHVFSPSASGFVWIMDCGWRYMNLDWIKDHLPTCFGELLEERQVQLQYVLADIVMKPTDFIKYLNGFDNGLDLIYSERTKPFRISIEAVPLPNRPRLFEQNQIEFYYSLPHRYEYSVVQSTKKENIEIFIEAIRKTK